MVRKRKSPIRHSVKQHHRESYTVHSYIRGKGSRPNPFVKRRVLGKDEYILCEVEGKLKPGHCGTCDKPEDGFSTEHELRLYTAVFTYEDGSTETLKTAAKSPRQALRFTDIKRERRDERPTEIIIKNRLGKVVSTIGKTMYEAGVAVGEKGKEAAVRLKEEVKALPPKIWLIEKEFLRISEQAVKYAGTKIEERGEDWWKWKMARPILLKCQSKDLETRIRALQELRRKYPDIYIAAGFGKVSEVYGFPKKKKPTPHIT